MRGLNPHVSVDCVIFGFDFDRLNVLLIERDIHAPHKNNIPQRRFALPGNLVDDNENLDESARRVLRELTNLDDIYLEQFYAFGSPNRVQNEYDRHWLRTMRADPDARVITIAYFSLVKLSDYHPSPSSWARSAVWCPVEDIPDLAFDHNEIMDKAIVSLRNMLATRPIAFKLLPEKFTFGQLQKVYEVVMGTTFDKRNFRRKITNMKILIPLEEKQQGVPHKPARLYRFDSDKYREMLTEDLVFAV
ncbi:MAG: NUDIX domain-containing protein [Bacteroidota bacterium]